MAAGRLEEGLVVEQRPGGGDEGQAVLGPLVLSGVDERGEEVGLDGYGEDLLGGVELTGGRVVGVGADLRDVGGLVGLDHLGDLAVDVVPGLDLHLDLDAGVPGLEGGDEVGPVLLGGVAAGEVVVGGDQSEGHVAGVPSEGATMRRPWRSVRVRRRPRSVQGIVAAPRLHPPFARR